MYTEFYNLKEMPFTISTEPRFLWLGEKHQEALANLKYGLLEADGYVVLTGDVGIGKTTLVNALLDEIDDSVLTTTISHPTLPPEEFFRYLARTWGGPQDLQGKTDLLFFFKEFLEKSRAEGRTILLIIDEAHKLSEELLEEIRLLSNIEQEGKRLVNIFFVGQIELKEMLLSPQFRALRQRITLFYYIEPLNVRETAEYIIHRLKVAGGSGSIFSMEAIRQIHHFSKGYPRLINTLCGRAMLTGYVQNKRRLDAAIVSECVEELGYLDPKAPDVSSSYRREQQMLREKVILGEVDRMPSSTVNAGAEETQMDLPADGATGKKPEPPRRRKQRKKGWTVVFAVLLVCLAMASALAWVSFTERGKEVAGKLEIERWLAEISFSLPELNLLRPSSSPLPKSNPPAETGKGPLNTPADERLQVNTADNGIQTAATDTPDNSAMQKQQRDIVNEGDTGAAVAEGRQDASDEQTDDANVVESPTTAERASKALAQKRYGTVIDMLAPGQEEDVKQNEALLPIYAQALAGRAEEIMKTTPDEALAMLEEAVRIDRGLARAHFLLGKIHTAENRYIAAIDAYQEGVRYDPGSADTFFNLGFVYAAMGKYEQAEHSFQRTIELGAPYLGKALFNLAVVQDRLGKKDDSLTNLEKAQLHSPENDKISAYLQKIVAEQRSSP
jgi:type II secretory pathway predicted ATPase ExeA/tetratricopeptide (TPR) repeat protein